MAFCRNGRTSTWRPTSHWPGPGAERHKLSNCSRQVRIPRGGGIKSQTHPTPKKNCDNQVLGIFRLSSFSPFRLQLGLLPRPFAAFTPPQNAAVLPQLRLSLSFRPSVGTQRNFGRHSQVIFFPFIFQNSQFSPSEGTIHWQIWPNFSRTLTTRRDWPSGRVPAGPWCWTPPGLRCTRGKGRKGPDSAHCPPSSLTSSLPPSLRCSACSVPEWTPRNSSAGPTSGCSRTTSHTFAGETATER